jgi:hypothetical protein
VTISDAATVTAVAAIENYTFGNFTNTFTSGVAADQSVTGGIGTDTFRYTLDFDVDDTLIGGGGTDTLDIAYNLGTYDFSSVGTNVQSIENLILSVAQTAAATFTQNADFLTFDASANTNAMTLDATLATNTSVKLGSGNDTITTVAANTAAQTIELGAGNDTITSLSTGNAAMTIDSGTGNLTITDIAAHGSAALTLKFGTLAAATQTVNVAGTTDDFDVGDIFDFATNVTSIVNAAATGVNGVAGAAGQLFIDTTTQTGNTIITFDADGSRTFGVGDVQITIVGNLLNGGIDPNGNFLIGSSS